MVTLLVFPERGVTQMENSPRFYCTTTIWRPVYDGACSPNISFRMV